MDEMYIQFHDTVIDHPKTLKCARDLGIGVVQMVGHLGCLWSWALRMAPDGELSSFEIDDIELGAKWEGEQGKLVRVLEKRRFLDKKDGFYFLHDWEDYAEHLKARERKRRERERKRFEGVTDVTGRHVTSRDVVGNDHTCHTCHKEGTEQNRTEQKDRESAHARDTGITKTKSLRCTALDDPLESDYEHQEYVWQGVIKDWNEISGLPHDAQTNRDAAESILRLASAVTPRDSKSLVRKVLKNWQADDWVKKTKPALSNLAKFFDRYISPPEEEKPEPSRASTYERDTRIDKERERREKERFENEDPEERRAAMNAAKDAIAKITGSLSFGESNKTNKEKG